MTDHPSGARVEGLSALRIVELTGGRWTTEPEFTISGIAPIDEAGPSQLGFLADRRYASRLPDSTAGALLIAEKLLPMLGKLDRPCLVSPDAHAALRSLLTAFHPERKAAPSIHPTAVLGRGVTLGAEVVIGPYAVLEDEVRIGDRVQVGPHVVLGRGATVGDGSILHPHAVLYPGVRIGERVILHAGVRLGVDGFGYVFDDGRHVKVPQVGGCEIGDDVEIGANSCVDRGSIGTTTIQEGTKVDNLVHLGHNVHVGRSAVLVAQVGVAGSARIGDGAVLGGQAGLGGHIEVGREAKVAGQSGVIGDIPPGATVSGYPARDHRKFLRGMAEVMRLPGMVRRIRELEARLEAVEDEREAGDPGPMHPPTDREGK